MEPRRTLWQRLSVSHMHWWAFCISLLLLPTPDASGQVLTLTPSLAISERYDNNIFQDNAGKEDDFVTVVTPGILLQYIPSSATELNLDYRPSFELFADHTGENQVTQRGSLRFTGPLSRLFSLSLQETLTITEEPGDRILEVDQATGLRTESQEGRQRTIRNTAGGDLQVQLAPRSSLGLLFDSLLEDIENAEEVDEFRYTVGAELGYIVHVARQSRVSLSSDVTFHTFAANDPAVQDPEGFRVHTVNIGLRHAFSATLTGNATAGYAIAQSDDPDIDGDAAIISNIRLVKTLRTGQALIGFRRRSTSGGGEGGNVIASTFLTSISARISPKVTTRLGANVSLFDFDEATDDRLFFVIRPGVAYQIFRFWLLSVDYDYSMSNFDEPDRADETNHRLTVASRFTLRTDWFLSLTYRYRTRRFGDALDDRSDDEFARHIIELTLIYAPTFHF